nr:synaptotagmin [Hymenolepis microstoma]
MAHLLQKSNQPSYNTNSWGGLFTCCFTRSKTPSPNPPPIPFDANLADGTAASVNKAMYDSWAGKTSQEHSGAPQSVTLSEIAGRKAIGEASSGQVTPGRQASPAVKFQAPPSNTTGEHQELPKEREVGDGNSVVSQASAESASVRNKGKRAENKSATTKAKGKSPIDTHSSHTSVREFVEESNPNGFNSLPQGNLSLQEPLSVVANATVHTHVKMDYKSSEMTIQIKNVENAPGEENAGSQAYQVRLALIGLRKKKRWHSHIVPAPNPTFNEEAIFKGITSDELAKLALRIRLYGCRKHRRHFIFAESIVSILALNLRGGEASIPFALISKVGHESVVDSESDIGDDSMGGSRFGSRLSLSSRASRRSSSRTHQTGSEHQRPQSAKSVAWKTANTGVLPELATARRVVADREANWPELLCGLAYNSTTKRLSVSVLRTNRLKVPDASFRSPKVFVSLTLVSENGEEITSSQTHDVHLAANTEFGEKFAFDMNSHSPREVTLFVRVFQKHHIHKHDSLGWFAMGSKNNGEEERSHWNEMLQAQGKEISRWHVLNENVS